MKNRDELMEASVMIKLHCRSTKIGDRCQFSYKGVCEGEGGCRLSGSIPDAWDVKCDCRWEKRDYNLAKSLKEFGIDFVERWNNSGYVRFGRGENSYEKDRLPVGSFNALTDGEKVGLSKIIKEYEECNGGMN